MVSAGHPRVTGQIEECYFVHKALPDKVIANMGTVLVKNEAPVRYFLWLGLR